MGLLALHCFERPYSGGQCLWEALLWEDTLPLGGVLHVWGLPLRQVFCGHHLYLNTGAGRSIKSA